MAEWEMEIGERRESDRVRNRNRGEERENEGK